jgi:hypothetical protein
MIFYIASPIYQQIIHKTIQESGLVIAGCETSSEIYFGKYIKENLGKINGLDCLILDIAAVQDSDGEIIAALETLRIMEADTRIIILAANRAPGDDLLIKCFNMSIYDLIVTADFVEIRDDLMQCLVTGKQYKDTMYIRNKPTTKNKSEQEEVRTAASKIMIGMAGAMPRIGTTHHSILLANYLRHKKYMVALVEYNGSGAFAAIGEEEKKFDGNYFSIGGIDYYPAATAEKLQTVLSKAYNFVIVDFGSYLECDLVTYHKCNECFLFLGSKPWETASAVNIFAKAKESATSYHYYFNFCGQDIRTKVKKSMEGIESVHFLENTPDPFTTQDFPDVETILKKYLPNKEKPKKKFAITLGRKG